MAASRLVAFANRSIEYFYDGHGTLYRSPWYYVPMAIYTCEVYSCNLCGKYWLPKNLSEKMRKRRGGNELIRDDFVMFQSCPRCNSARWNDSSKAHVYVLGEESGIYFKIGWSFNPSKRAKDISILMPFPVNEQPTMVSGIMTRGTAASREKFLHGHFAEKRVNGEWFKLEAEDFAALEEFFSLWSGIEQRQEISSL